MREGRRPRVFCIGWHKTGTSSLGHALVALGYNVLGCRLDMVHPLERGDLRAVMNLAAAYDALQDVPWAALFRELDQRFPGSRFILTERDDDAWLRSAIRHFGSTDIPLHRYLYGAGVMQGNEEIYLERYRRHNEEVKAYFSNRQSDILLLDLSSGDGWIELCRFLGEDVPRKPFPHANKGPQSYTAKDRVGHAVRRWVPMPVRQLIFWARQGVRGVLGRPDPRDIFNNFTANRAERSSWKQR